MAGNGALLLGAALLVAFLASRSQAAGAGTVSGGSSAVSSPSPVVMGFTPNSGSQATAPVQGSSSGSSIGDNRTTLTLRGDEGSIDLQNFANSLQAGVTYTPYNPGGTSTKSVTVTGSGTPFVTPAVGDVTVTKTYPAGGREEQYTVAGRTYTRYVPRS